MKRCVLLELVMLFSVMACSTLNTYSSAEKETELVNNGYIALIEGDYATAEYLLNQALLINSKNPYALLNLGVVCQNTFRYEKARQLYQTVIELDPAEKAAASNIVGSSGKTLAEIARINMRNLPQPSVIDYASNNGVDTDGDGVMDDLDKCLNTPAKAVVIDNGCWVLSGLFASGQASIRPQAYKQLDDVVMILQENPSMRIEIQGHTDNTGRSGLNLRLSEKRAQSVMTYLIKKGIRPVRLQIMGYGQSRPIASNQTSEGRMLNRRIELLPLAQQ